MEFQRLERTTVGDKVVANGWGLSQAHHGGYAQKARINGNWLVKIPAPLSSRDAMAIGTAGCTAMLSVLALEHGGITPRRGDILVTGASGGVGSIAIRAPVLGYRSQQNDQSLRLSNGPAPVFYEHFMEPLCGLFVPLYLIGLRARHQRRSTRGESSMWIEEVAPERVTELFHNYQCALGVFGPKGSESGSWKESPQPKKNRVTGAADVEFESEESRDHFAQPGEAEWGC